MCNEVFNRFGHKMLKVEDAELVRSVGSGVADAT